LLILDFHSSGFVLHMRESSVGEPPSGFEVDAILIERFDRGFEPSKFGAKLGIGFKLFLELAPLVIFERA